MASKLHRNLAVAAGWIDARDYTSGFGRFDAASHNNRQPLLDTAGCASAGHRAFERAKVASLPRYGSLYRVMEIRARILSSLS